MLFVVGASSASGAETKSAVSGQSNFESKCSRCHGTSGKGNGFQALALFFMFRVPDLTNSAFMQTRSDDALFRSIKQGSKGGMPAYGLKFSESEIKDLVVYVRGFTGGR
ncbi:MAG: cytochrome c [Candidatus Methylomirabilis oxygeniifera]|nr:MAG: cytochrome c [Candidatus Methylomirabilis oxyfera]